MEVPLRPIPDSAIHEKPLDLSHELPRITPRRKPAPARKSSTSVPTTPPLPPPPSIDDITFTQPTRRILTPHDHELFLASATHTLITSFIFNISDSIKDTPISSVSTLAQHPTIAAVLSILTTATTILAAHPASPNNNSRFGNPTFRAFLSTLASQLPHLHTTHFPTLTPHPGAILELTTYLSSSLGSPLRLDYGSGHELHFLTYLLCLNRLSLLPPSTFPSAALLLLPAYLTLMRSLQSTYYLEPAGSHGVWGLDDYHFLPFLFGASQLATHPVIRPLAIHSATALEVYADEFLYLDMVRAVNATKTVRGLRWHSPMLDDISGVREGWGKIEGGMRKMFEREVLGKLVVMQHFLFGGLVPAVDGMGGGGNDDDGESGEVANGAEGHGKVAEGHPQHRHNQDAWGDCCGIKVPSSVGALQEMKKRTGEEGLRRLPFD